MDRSTPYHFPHTTEVAGCAFVSGGDDRYRNNLFTAALTARDDCPGQAALEAYAGYPTSLDGIHPPASTRPWPKDVQGGGDPYPRSSRCTSAATPTAACRRPSRNPMRLALTAEPVSAITVEETP